MKITFLTVLLSSALLSSIVGCAADASDDPSNGGEDESFTDDDNEVKSNVLGDVAAIKVQGHTLGAPKKVSKILSLTKLGVRNKTPDEGAFRCMPTYRLEFLDKKGELVASGGFLCGGGAPSADAKGYITVRRGAQQGTSYLIKGDAKQIDDLSKEPLQVDDVLFGIDKVEFSKPGRQEPAVSTKDAEQVGDALAALKPTQAPNPNAMFPRCLPGHVVTFSRGSKQIGSASFSCGGGGGTDIQASFSSQNGEEIHGAIRINATTLVQMEEKLRAGAN